VLIVVYSVLDQRFGTDQDADPALFSVATYQDANKNIFSPNILLFTGTGIFSRYGTFTSILK
jgi:hypothetical protein